MYDINVKMWNVDQSWFVCMSMYESIPNGERKVIVLGEPFDFHKPK